MSEPIKVGDLAVVVRWPCCNAQVGKMLTISAIAHGSGFLCQQCLNMGPTEQYASDGKRYAPLSWLKRIPPLADLESVQTREPTHETA